MSLGKDLKNIIQNEFHIFSVNNTLSKICVFPPYPENKKYNCKIIDITDQTEISNMKLELMKCNNG